GPLTGVVHCAGVVRDAYIANKTPDEVRAVLAPKIAGLHALDEATRHCALDFIVLFSSISAVLGNPGQADYAGANTYMDEFAEHRNRLVEQGQRSGYSLSINWPLWRDGGMHVSA